MQYQRGTLLRSIEELFLSTDLLNTREAEKLTMAWRENFALPPSGKIYLEDFEGAVSRHNRYTGRKARSLTEVLRADDVCILASSLGLPAVRAVGGDATAASIAELHKQVGGNVIAFDTAFRWSFFIDNEDQVVLAVDPFALG